MGVSSDHKMPGGQGVPRVGKVPAALAMYAMLAKYKCEVVIKLGTAGVTKQAGGIGDVFLGDCFVQHGPSPLPCLPSSVFRVCVCAWRPLCACVFVQQRRATPRPPQVTAVVSSARPLHVDAARATPACAAATSMHRPTHRDEGVR